MRAEDPEGVERGTAAIEWGSDALAELLAASASVTSRSSPARATGGCTTAW